MSFGKFVLNDLPGICRTVPLLLSRRVPSLAECSDVR
jgi:hypothetical protein